MKLHHATFLGYCALHLAQIAVAQDDDDSAAILLGAADGLWKSDNSPTFPTYRAAYARTCEMAKAAIGDSAFASLFADGQALSFEDAAAYALALGEASPV